MLTSPALVSYVGGCVHLTQKDPLISLLDTSGLSPISYLQVEWACCQKSPRSHSSSIMYSLSCSLSHIPYTSFPVQVTVFVPLSTRFPQPDFLVGWGAGLKPCPPTWECRLCIPVSVLAWDATPLSSWDSVMLASPQAQSASTCQYASLGP